jgi:hypothetical protein
LAEFRVTQEANDSSHFVPVLGRRDAVFRDLDLGDSTEREEQLDEILWGIFGSLANDVADRGGHSRLEQNASRLQSGEIQAHRLSWLKGSHDSPRMKLWASFRPIANRSDRQRPYLADELSGRHTSQPCRRDAGPSQRHSGCNFALLVNPGVAG